MLDEAIITKEPYMDITKNITPEELAAHIEKEGIKVPGSDKVMTPEEFREYT